MRTIILFLLLLLVACDRSERQGATPPDGRSGGAGVTATYDRSFLLLSLRADTPVAAALEFTTVEGPTSIRRTADAWLARNRTWLKLLEQAWETEPIREPWRLVPHGPFRLVVGEGNEIEALIHRDDSTGFRLEPAEPLAEWGAGDGVQLRLRRGTLSLGRESFVGLLLDLQTGAPITQPGGTEVVFVTDGQRRSLVVARSADGRGGAWLRGDTESVDWDRVTITPIPAEGSGPGTPPAGWRVSEPTGALAGEFYAEGEPITVRYPSGVARGSRTIMVRGWVSVRGDRRDVFGLLRHGLE